MEALARLEAQVERLLAAHGEAREQAARAAAEADRLGAALHERQRQARQLEERLAQALRRVHDLEQERARLHERLAALPDEASVAEARRRLQHLLETLETEQTREAGRGDR